MITSIRSVLCIKVKNCAAGNNKKIQQSDEEYEYDYGSDAEYDYGSDQEMNEDNGNSELIEIENAFYGMTKLISITSLIDA